MKSLNFLMALSLSLIALNSHADATWHHVPAIQSGDLTAQIDFQAQNDYPGVISQGGPATYQLTATRLSLNVRLQGLSEQDQVHVMIINYHRDLYRGEPRGNGQTITETDLHYAEPGHFAGELTPMVFAYQYNNGYAVSTTYYWQELVIWVNGRIYKDPRTGQNLQFNLANVR